MNKFEKHPIVKRFRKAYEYLVYNEKVKNKTEFAKKLEMQRTSVGESMSGKRLPSIAMIGALHHKFGVNTNYIFWY